MQPVDHGNLPHFPFRVINPKGCKLFTDKQLTKPSVQAAIEFDSIISAIHLNDKVIFVGDPYYSYIKSSDVSPLDNKALGFEQPIPPNKPSSKTSLPSLPSTMFNGTLDLVEINDDNNSDDDDIKSDISHLTGTDGPQFIPPQLITTNQAHEASETIPSIPSGKASGRLRSNTNQSKSLQYNSKSNTYGIIKGITRTDETGLVNMLQFNTSRPGSSKLGNRTNINNNISNNNNNNSSSVDIVYDQEDSKSYNNDSSNNAQNRTRSGTFGTIGDENNNNNNNYRHTSSRSQSLFPSHQSNRSRSPHSVRSNNTNTTTNNNNNEFFEDAGSHYESDVSVGSFVPLPRQRTVADGLKMGYTKGIGTSIPASQIKTPLIYNQITNEILIKQSKAKGEKKIKDNILINKFNDARPKLDKEYFKMSKDVRGGLVVVIPFFNEPASELEATLRYLHSTYTWMCETDPSWKKRPMDICMIQDGWFKADDSMQRYLKKMFPKQYYIDPNAKDELESQDEKTDYKEDASVSKVSQNLDDLKSESKQTELLPEVTKYWWEYLPEFLDYDKKRDGPVTYVFEKTHDNPSFFELKFEKNESGKIDKRMEIQKRFRITLIVKIDNRRKHNSHEWFLGENGFSDAYQAKYLFATDAFTLFQPSCMYHMVHYLDTHPDTAAVTGRQRAMNRIQQDKDGKEFALSLAYVLRMTQTFDFELTSGVFNPVYGVCGFLPVIPGPCGLYRCSDVGQNKARYWYFDIVNAEPTETGLVLGNLRIAEDRILTYASILKVADYRRMAFVPAGLFFFETETDLSAFIFQRRRWINGTFAGFIYILITAPYHVWGWHANFWIKFKVWLLLVINFAQLSTVVLSPAISFSILDTSLSYMLSKMVEHHKALHSNIMLTGWVIWCLHIIIHNRAKFSPIIMKVLYGWSVLISCSLIITYFILFIVEQQNVYDALLEENMKPSELDFVLGLMAFGTIVPFSCQYMVGGWEAVGILLKSTVHYFLSFHLMIPWFTSYAFARCWDLTWGNRPAEGEMDEVEEEKFQAAEIMKAKFLQYSRLVSLAMMAANISLALLDKYYIILIMSGFLMATAFFMGASFFVLLTQAFCGEWLTNLLSRSLEEYRKSAEREKEEEVINGGKMESIGHHNFKHSKNENNDNEEYSSDDDYITIPNDYQRRPDISQQNMSDEDDDDYYNNYEYDQYGQSIDNSGNWGDIQNVDNNSQNYDTNQSNIGYDDPRWAQYDTNELPRQSSVMTQPVGQDLTYTGTNVNINMDEEKNIYEYEYDEEQYQGYYDENGTWIDTTGGYYDEDGNWIDENGGYYDENGNYITDNGNIYGSYDDQPSTGGDIKP